MQVVAAAPDLSHRFDDERRIVVLGDIALGPASIARAANDRVVVHAEDNEPRLRRLLENPPHELEAQKVRAD